MRKITFSYSRTGAVVKHYLNEEDVKVLLSRLPEELWERLRAVHFNDRARGRRMAGYVNMGHREIAILRSAAGQLSAFITHRSPRPFGALRGRQWPEAAVRRFMLYDVFLHELGHLQVIDSAARRIRRRFASETKAQEFADEWRARLWSEWFDHADPVHNPASPKSWAVWNETTRPQFQSTAKGSLADAESQGGVKLPKAEHCGTAPPYDFNFPSALSASSAVKIFSVVDPLRRGTLRSTRRRFDQRPNGWHISNQSPAPTHTTLWRWAFSNSHL